MRLIPIVRSPDTVEDLSADEQREIVNQYCQKRRIELVLQSDGSCWPDSGDLFKQAVSLSMQEYNHGLIFFSLYRWRSWATLRALSKAGKHVVAVFDGIDTELHGGVQWIALLTIPQTGTSNQPRRRKTKELPVPYGYRRFDRSGVSRNLPNEAELVFTDRLIAKYNEVGADWARLAGYMNQFHGSRRRYTGIWDRQAVKKIIIPICVRQGVAIGQPLSLREPGSGYIESTDYFKKPLE